MNEAVFLFVFSRPQNGIIFLHGIGTIHFLLFGKIIPITYHLDYSDNLKLN